MQALEAPVRAPTLAEKVAFLADARAYEDRPRRVECVETHMSWVFLTERHAFKLKKPLRLDHHDLTTVAAREAHCHLEIRLNRRLTDDVYLDAVRLGQRADGSLALGAGEPVDWLVRMRRLPRALMLDTMIRTGYLRRRDVRSFAGLLARFYRLCSPEPLTAPEFRARIAARIADSVRTLCRFPHDVPAPLAEDLGERQLAFLEAEAALVDARVAGGFVVEGHGDLRPEHVCLEVRPQIFDCLEFSRDLRVVDAAEELGFLALECERLGAPALRDMIFDAYGEVSGDRPDARLVHFYQSVHACVRARLAILHLDDSAPRDPARWPAQARDYLRLATEHISAAGGIQKAL